MAVSPVASSEQRPDTGTGWRTLFMLSVWGRLQIRLDTGLAGWHLGHWNSRTQGANFPSMAASPEKKGWLNQAVLRIKTFWLLKMLGTPGYIAIFMLCYFWLLRHPLFPVTIVPLTGLDRLIPFQPWSIVPYASLWLYISLVPLLFSAWRELAPYLGAVTLLSVAGFAVFLFWPTAIPRPDIDWTRYPSVAFLKSVDASGNACPSLHVAFAVLSGIWLQRLLKQMGTPLAMHLFNVCWCLLIVYSTLAIKQHVALDLEAGAVLGLCVSLLFLHLLPKLQAVLGVSEPG
jgi:membrane-associated phospholipid phosphatase